MQTDEQEIRELVSAWLDASKAGDVDKLLSLMTEDVVFLTGQQVMRKADFADAAGAQASGDAPQFDGSSEIQEIKIFGEWAFLWQKLTVKLTSPSGNSTSSGGYTLTILNKQNDQWKLARDANTLAPPDK